MSYLSALVKVAGLPINPKVISTFAKRTQVSEKALTSLLQRLRQTRKAPSTVADSGLLKGFLNFVNTGKTPINMAPVRTPLLKPKYVSITRRTLP